MLRDRAHVAREVAEVKPVNPPVCVDSTAVGMTETSMPMAEIIGRATVSEHLPKPEISCIAAALLSLSSVSLAFHYDVRKLVCGQIRNIFFNPGFFERRYYFFAPELRPAKPRFEL